MIKPKISIKYDKKSLSDKILNNIPKAKRAVLQEMIEDTEPYIPYDTGYLNNSVGMDIEKGEIIYDAPYAKYAFNPKYKGKQKLYNRQHHPLARGNPFNASRKYNIDKWLETFKRVLMGGK